MLGKPDEKVRTDLWQLVFVFCFSWGDAAHCEEECNEEQMSLNEHVKTIKPHNQGGSAMNGETRVMSEDINMDRISVSSWGNNIRLQLLRYIRFISATKGLNTEFN